VVELADSPAAVPWTRRGPSGGELTVKLIECVGGRRSGAGHGNGVVPRGVEGAVAMVVVELPPAVTALGLRRLWPRGQPASRSRSPSAPNP